MPALSRVFQKQFGASANPTELGKFGSLAAGNASYTSDPTLIQSLTAFLGGWYSAIVGGNSPAIQDMNALFYLVFYQLCYIFQAGIPEWDASTTYYKGSRVRVGTQNFISVVDNNLNQTCANNMAYWKPNDGALKTLTSVNGQNTTVKMDGSEDYVRCDCSPGGNLALFLPQASTIPQGKKFIFKNVTPGTSNTFFTLNTYLNADSSYGTDRIDGQLQLFLFSSPNRESITVVNNGSGYDII